MLILLTDDIQAIIDIINTCFIKKGYLMYRYYMVDPHSVMLPCVRSAF